MLLCNILLIVDQYVTQKVWVRRIAFLQAAVIDHEYVSILNGTVIAEHKSKITRLIRNRLCPVTQNGEHYVRF